jgi:glycerophosphoryl diester phosphodiesterase
MSFNQRPVLEVIGHGGAGDFFPGNTRASIEQALKIGVDRIEIDIQQSADGDLVLVHDKELLFNGQKTRVRYISTEQLRRVLPGLLTFDEMVDLNRDRVPLLLDVKLPGYEREIVAAIRRHNLAGSVAASSTYGNALKKIGQSVPGMRLGLSTGHMATGIHNRAIRAVVVRALRVATPPTLVLAMGHFGATETMIQHRVCTPRLVDAVHRSGRRVYVWTVDRPEQMRRFIAMAVDGIISNRPDLVKEALAKGLDDESASLTATSAS